MQFGKKLDLIMSITQTTNRELGQALRIDPSQVSRVRNNRRKPVGVFLEPAKIADFFISRLREEYQFHALEKALDLPFSLPKGAEELHEVLTGTLRQDEPTRDWIIPGPRGSIIATHQLPKTEAEEVPIKVYYGAEGNEAAKVFFLQSLAAMDTPKTACLFNNDDMVWMKEDTAIARQINAITQEIFARGHRVRVVFSGERNIDQMQAIVEEWLPLLLERQVEVFYYPGQIDGLFRRHISVVNGTLALTSSSVGEMNREKMTMIYTDKKMIRALQKEYEQLLFLSKPLFNIYQGNNEKQMLQDITTISKEETPTFRYADPLPLNTMPAHVFATIYERMNYKNKDQVARQYQDIYRYNEWNLQRVPILEMIRLPLLQEVLAEKIPVEQSLYFPMDKVFYTPREYALQLHHIIQQLRRHENYRMYLTDEPLPTNHLLLIKKGMNVMASSKRYPPMIMTTREPIIVDIFWDHYMEKTGLDKSSLAQKQRVIKELEQYLQQLETKLAEQV